VDTTRRELMRISTTSDLQSFQEFKEALQFGDPKKCHELAEYFKKMFEREAKFYEFATNLWHRYAYLFLDSLPNLTRNAELVGKAHALMLCLQLIWVPVAPRRPSPPLNIPNHPYHFSPAAAESPPVEGDERIVDAYQVFAESLLQSVVKYLDKRVLEAVGLYLGSADAVT
jgi:hypothetical protein